VDVSQPTLAHKPVFPTITRPRPQWDMGKMPDGVLSAKLSALLQRAAA